LKLAKICVDLCPESFEAWFLLSECYFYMKKIKLSLVVLDIAPLYPDIELVNDVPNTQEYDIMKPKEANSQDTHGYMMLAPRHQDYRDQNDPQALLYHQVAFMRNEEPELPIERMPSQQFEAYSKLKKVNLIEMTSRERRCYELIVKMEKEYGWDILIKIKNATFISEEEQDHQTDWQNPYFNKDFTRKKKRDSQQKQGFFPGQA